MIPGAILGISGGGLGFTFLGYLMWQQYMITLEQAYMVAVFGTVIALIGALISWILDHVKGTAILKDADQPGRYLALHISRGGLMQPVWSYRNPQGFIGIKGKGMIRDRGEGALSFCGHPTRMVYETIGATLDPRMIVAINELIQKYGIDTIYEAREMAEIITRHEGLGDEALEEALREAGFNPDPVMLDREYNTKVSQLANEYFTLRKKHDRQTKMVTVGAIE